MQAIIVMSDSYTYTLAGETLGSARQHLDIIYIPGILAFTASPVRPLLRCHAVHHSSSCLKVMHADPCMSISRPETQRIHVMDIAPVVCWDPKVAASVV